MSTPRPAGITEEQEAQLLAALGERITRQGVTVSQPYRNGALRTIRILFGESYAEALRAKVLIKWQRARFATKPEES